MKASLVFPVIISLGLASCEMLKQSQTASLGTGFDPLSGPGARSKPAVAETDPANLDPSLQPGMYVQAIMDNTSFFKTKPQGIADASRLLKSNTNMKIIANEGDYVKVSLDNGDVGYVLSPQIADKRTIAANQATQPVPEQPLPVVKPGDMPPNDAIPTILDPEPATPAPAPPSTPTDHPPTPDGASHS